jgi:hypothetical protein
VSGEEKKERVLHTRIPAALEDQIKRLAEALRVPVSNLVRNMLEDAIDVTRRMRDHIPGGDHAKEQEDLLAEIYGWQGLTLNVDVACARCKTEMAAGEQAHVGLSNHPRDAKVFVCSSCLPGAGATNGQRKMKRRE